jgi:hypothetical protein
MRHAPQRLVRSAICEHPVSIAARQLRIPLLHVRELGHLDNNGINHRPTTTPQQRQ